MSCLELHISHDTLQYSISANGVMSSPKLKRTTLFLGEEMYDLIAFQDDLLGVPSYISELKIVIENESMDIPVSQKKNILKYLQSSKIWEEMDCHLFLLKICNQLADLLDMVKYDEGSHYKPGSLSYVLDGNGVKVHSQLYIGRGLFMGKGGKKGPFMISTAIEMEKLRGGVETYIQNTK